MYQYLITRRKLIITTREAIMKRQNDTACTANILILILSTSGKVFINRVIFTKNNISIRPISNSKQKRVIYATIIIGQVKSDFDDAIPIFEVNKPSASAAITIVTVPIQKLTRRQRPEETGCLLIIFGM
jgi:hypothetical protein